MGATTTLWMLTPKNRDKIVTFTKQNKSHMILRFVCLSSGALLKQNGSTSDQRLA